MLVEVIAMKKYGMDYSTIRYWQNHAKSFVTHNGRRDVFQRSLMYLLRGDKDSRYIAHYAIACAAVYHPSAVKYAIENAFIQEG